MNQYVNSSALRAAGAEKPAKRPAPVPPAVRRAFDPIAYAAALEVLG